VETSTHTNCLLCDHSSLKVLRGYEKDHLVRCRKCSFVFSSRIPSAEELVTFYEGYQRANAISPITIKRYHELLDQFEEFRSTGNIIDIGCGDGYFLEVAKERGWNVFGVEFTDEALEVCSAKGITMLRGPLEAANYEPDFFDVVTSFEVIEHIYNPRKEVSDIRTILRKDGLFYVTTPNFNSISRSVLGHKWTILNYPEHLSYYTRKTMNRFMKTMRFTKLRTETTGIGIQRFRTAVTGEEKSQEALREKTETRALYRLAKKTINGLLRFTASGDAMKGYFINSK